MEATVTARDEKKAYAQIREARRTIGENKPVYIVRFAKTGRWSWCSIGSPLSCQLDPSTPVPEYGIHPEFVMDLAFLTTTGTRAEVSL